MKPALFLLTAALLTQAASAQRVADDPAARDPFRKRAVPARVVPAGRYASHLRVGNTLRIKTTDGSTLQLIPWGKGVVRLDYFAPGRAPEADSSISVVQTPQDNYRDTNASCRPGCDGPPSQEVLAKYGRDYCAGIAVEANRITYGIDCLSIEIDKATLQVTIRDLNTGVLTMAESPFRREAAPPTPATAPEAGGVGVRFRLAPGEHLYGTGSRALPLDRRGYRLELYNQAHYASQNGEQNLNLALPTVLSSRGYMLFFDNHAAGFLDLGKTEADVLEYGGEALNALSYYVITGRDQGEILNRYTALTGRQPLPPRWALGLIQSRFGYKSDQEMYRVAERMRREDFPLDALVLDLFWFGGIKQQGDLAWDRAHFPDPAGMMRRLRQEKVKTILISEPYVMRASRNDSTVRTLGLVGTEATGLPYTVASFWAGPASILDMSKPRTRRWLWDHYQPLHDQGVAGWWSDLGEPENHPEAMHHINGPARQIHNGFGQSWAGIFSENYQKRYPQERLFNLARSGWAGVQRESVFPWSGDINRSWSGYRAQVPGMLGVGQGGVGYMHSDAGGFCVGGIDPELYTRWLQMASLCPILRPHGEGVPPEPYYYPNPYKSAVRAATHLRYELLPYLYTLAWLNTTTGAPLVRSMNYGRQYPVVSSQTAGYDDQPPTTDYQNEQYLLGPDLLVAPVLNPGQRRRNVLLPSGSWIDYRTNQTYPGGRTVGVVAPLAHAPLLVRAGAFIPTTAYRRSTDLYQPDTLLLRYYPDPRATESEFTMYDDDGHSAKALTEKKYETLTMRGFYSSTQTDVLLNSNGDYPGQPVFRLLRLLVQRVAAPPTAIYLDGQLAPAEGWTYRPETHELEVHFLMNAGTAVSMRGLRLLTAPLPDLDPDVLTLEAPNDRAFGPGGTTLHYARHTPGGPDQLRIRNAQGQLVRTLPLAQTTGPHELKFDAQDAAGRALPEGVYWAEVAGQHQRLIVRP